MKPNPLAALYHFTVRISWTLASKGCRFNGDLKFFRGGRGCGAAIYAYDFRHLKTPLRRSRPELDRHAWLESADAYAYDCGSMEESIAGPVRELDEAVPLSRIELFQFTPNRRRGRLTELCFGKLRRDLGMDQRVAVVPLLLLTSRWLAAPSLFASPTTCRRR
jgi:hypothetical protein